MDVVELSLDYGGRTLTLQTGKIAKQADASVLVTYGETVVLVAVASAKSVKAGQDFFPLTVDFQERYYSAGRVPGGFFKREAKPSDRATLSARCIDRPCRPLFPEDYLADTFVTATVISSDGTNEADVAAMIGASAALHISDIPFNGPIGACRVGYINGEFITNISPAQQAESTVDLLVAGVKTGVIMVEGSAKEVSEQVMMDAIDHAHKQMQPVMDMIEELRKKTGSKPKRDYEKPPKDEKLKAELKKFLWASFGNAFAVREKLARYEALAALKETASDKFKKDDPQTDEEKTRNKLVDIYVEELKATFARELTVDTKKRIDGRGYKDIRNISCEVKLLPRVHGTGLFTRGETQVLSAVTLGTSDDEQKIDSITGTYQKTFMLHYNFPPFSVGEARPLRPPGRREIGHGFLAERALSYVIPSKEVFPYTIRIVAEVLESNGSSSMASVCSGSLALMDAGVPIPKPVAGVAMGLIKEGDKVAVLTDILGDEDHLGDMDFKVCGTPDGVTAFQMDLKIGGVAREVMEQALEQAREGRMHILEKMNAVLSAPRTEMSDYAPRIHTIKVRPDKVREVIGSGGKVVRSIIEQTGVKIDIEDDGTIHIASADGESAQKAINLIQSIVAEPEPGKIYEGKVTRIAEFGAFVEIIPGTDGLVHISELAHHRVRRVEDVLKEGDIIKVKCLDVESNGKIRLSLRALLPKDGGPGPGGEGGGSGGGGGSDRGERSEREPRGDRERGGGDRGPRSESAPRTERPERAERSEPRPERNDRPNREGGSDRDEEPVAIAEGASDAPLDEENFGNRAPSPREGFASRDREPRDREPRRDTRGGFGGGGDRDRGPRRDAPPRRDDRGGDRGGMGGGGGRGPRRDYGAQGGRDDSRGPDRNADRGPDRGSDRGPRRDDNRGPMGGGDRGQQSRGPRSSGGGDYDRGGRSGGGRSGGGRGGQDRGPRGGGYDRGGERVSRGPIGIRDDQERSGREPGREPRFDDRLDRLEEMGRDGEGNAQDFYARRESGFASREPSRGGGREDQGNRRDSGGRGRGPATNDRVARGGTDDRDDRGPRFGRRDEFGGDDE